MNENSALGSAIEAGNVALPPFIGKLIQNAPESFADPRAGQVAATVRAMRHAGEPVNCQTVAGKHLPLVSFIAGDLCASALPLDSAEFYAGECWREFQGRKVQSILAEAHAQAISHPDQSPAIAAAARAALDSITSETDNGLPELIDAADFVAEDIEELVELICGIAHRGSKIALGGGSKSFKTWCLLDMAVSVATGADWLGRRTTQGKVLLVNFEIQRKPMQHRLKVVAGAKGITWQRGLIDLWNLRGHAADYRTLIPKIIARARREGYALVILDPIYKLYGGTDENSAGDVAALLNSLERLATETGAAIAFGAHFAKGNASQREAIDRISGSGVFARDPDSLLIFTKHETQDAFTVEPILRNFAPVGPFAVRWEFPLMVLADDLDPSKLKKAGGRKPTYSPEGLLDLLPPGGLDNKAWFQLADENGISRRTFFRLRADLQKAGKILESAINGKWQPILTK